MRHVNRTSKSVAHIHLHGIEFQHTQGSHVTRRRKKINRSECRTVEAASVREAKRKTKRAGTLVEFLASSPLRASSLKVERCKDTLCSSHL